MAQEIQMGTTPNLNGEEPADSLEAEN